MAKKRVIDGVRVLWSPMNQAWFVTWGRGRVQDLVVLRVIVDHYELLDYLKFNLHIDPSTIVVPHSPRKRRTKRR